MKKNGFTLIELLATLAILAILATVLITVAVRKINDAKNQSKTTMIQSIQLAARNYAINYGNEDDNYRQNDYMYVTLQTLIEKNLLSESLIDQTKKEALNLSDYVYVTRENSVVTAYYDLNQSEHAKITLNGSYNLFVKKGNTFTDPGAKAFKNGSDVSSGLTISGSVDTNTKGTYRITYKYESTSITRNVVVY